MMEMRMCDADVSVSGWGRQGAGMPVMVGRQGRGAQIPCFGKSRDRQTPVWSACKSCADNFSRRKFLPVLREERLKTLTVCGVREIVDGKRKAFVDEIFQCNQ